MKADEKENIDDIKLRLAAALYQALKNSEFDSYRKLASKIGMESSHMQRIASGKTEVSFSTLLAIANGLSLSLSAFMQYYDNLTATQIQDFIKYREEQKLVRGKKIAKK
jgi:transcriptional regulator with XRE-family HTH domain